MKVYLVTVPSHSSQQLPVSPRDPDSRRRNTERPALSSCTELKAELVLCRAAELSYLAAGILRIFVILSSSSPWATQRALPGVVFDSSALYTLPEPLLRSHLHGITEGATLPRNSLVVGSWNLVVKPTSSYLNILPSLESELHDHTPISPRTVAHPSTNQGRCCLTSVIERELVFQHRHRAVDPRGVGDHSFSACVIELGQNRS